MKRFNSLAAALLAGTMLASGACSVPDGNDWRMFMDSVEDLPQPTVDQLKRSLMNKEATRLLKGRHRPDDVVGKVTCRSSKFPAWRVEVPEMRLLLKHVITCLESAEPRYAATVIECTEDQIRVSAKATEDDQARFEDNLGLLTDCRGEVEPNYRVKALPHTTTDPDSWRSNDLANFIVALTALEMSRMPSLMNALGISAVGGSLVAFDGIGLLLCPLSDAVYCPDDPSAPGVPQPGPGDGDHR